MAANEAPAGSTGQRGSKTLVAEINPTTGLVKPLVTQQPCW